MGKCMTTSVGTVVEHFQTSYNPPHHLIVIPLRLCFEVGSRPCLDRRRFPLFVNCKESVLNLPYCSKKAYLPL